MESTFPNPLSPLSERLAEVRSASNSINQVYEEIFHDLEEENKKLNEEYQALKLKRWNIDCEMKRMEAKNQKLKEKKESLGQKLEGMLEILPDFDAHRVALIDDSDDIEDTLTKIVDYNFNLDDDPRDFHDISD